MKSRKLYILIKHHIDGKVYYNHKLSCFTVLTKKESIRSCSRSEQVLKFFLEILRVFLKSLKCKDNEVMTLVFLITSLVTHMVTELPYSDKRVIQTIR